MATASLPRTNEGLSTWASKETADALVARAKELRPFLMEQAPEGERRRNPTEAVDRMLKEEGFLRMLLPQRLGGFGLSPTDFCRVQMEIAKGDPAISWVVQIVNGTSWITSLAPDGVQDAVFANGPAAVCGAYNPPGKARKVDGGWIINGAWPYTSGSRQSTWAQQGVVLEGYEGPVVPGISMCYIPFSDLTIKDSWYVTGMQGTGSDTSIATDVFIPDAQMVLMDERAGQIDRTKRHFGAPSDLLPAVPVVRTTGIAQLIGAVEAMFEIVRAEAPKKPVLTTIIGPRTSSGAYMRDLGEAAALIETAKLILFDLTAELDAVGLGAELTLETKARGRGQCGKLIELTHQASESLMFLAGSSAFSLDKPISRYWKDVSMGLRHIQNIPAIGYEIFGRNLTGATPISPPGAY
ncbi:acyl-CoA dehydrogenase family protein [Novosphingobium sp. CECT 9465]|uniref:acyl-CoA dehydrogenase family protein n=1 Tax=Novosphingobium sp. CECT 9465 TaxID=2829794 RepID=UPI001E39CFAB|nr:acyl-CoA dehydrogenase family protein [Novosphingobium sp. CECT 9465]CAH0498353.1 Flavin-dependent monooxygenase, oxygenase subunit HsaA [Novosphingobium sp. CECT 9465]